MRKPSTTDAPAAAATGRELKDALRVHPPDASWAEDLQELRRSVGSIPSTEGSPIAMPRIQPLEAPYEPEVEEQLAKWMPPGADVEPLALFRTLMVHPELASRMRPLGAGILGGSARVPPLDREVMIHRTCALTGAEYEWGVHAVAFGRPLGLSDEQIASTVHGSAGDGCWDSRQAAVFGLADELHATSKISDELWAQLGEHFAQDQLLELIVTAGWYHLIAYAINGLGIQPEPWAERFPPVAAAGTPPG